MAANNAQQAQLDAMQQQIDQLNANNQALQAQAIADAQQLQAAQAQAAADAQQLQAAAVAAVAAVPVNPPLPLLVVPTAYASCPGQHNSNKNLDFDKKTDLSIFNNGCKPIYDGEQRFDRTTHQEDQEQGLPLV